MAKQLQTVIVINGKASSSLNRAFQTAQKNAQKTSKAMQAIGTVTKIVFKAVTAGAAAAGAALVALGAKGIETASDLTEVQNVVDTTFGTSAKQINAWSDTALEAYGLSTLQAKQYTGTLGAMMKSSGIASDKITTMSTNLAGLAGDFASFYNLAQDDAFEKIRSGISGETEPLKALGINMSVANMEAFALTKGIKASWNEMDQAAQTQLRYLYLIEKSKDAQGDFSKTLDTSYANQKRVAVTKFNETLGKIAEKILPTALEVLKKVNAGMDNFVSGPGIQKVSAVIANVGDKIKWCFDNGDKLKSILDKIGGVVLTVTAAFVAYNAVLKVQTIIAAITKGYRVLSAAIIMYQNGAKLATIAQMLLNGAMAINPIALIIAGIVALVAGFVYLWNKCDKFRQFWINLWNGIVGAVKAVWSWIKENWALVLGFIINPFGSIFAALYKYNENFRNWVNGVVEIIKKPINWLITLINDKFIATLNKLKIPDWVPGVGGKGFNIPMIPQFAAGATVNRPTVGVFGEAGPETIVPHNNKPRSRALLAEAAAGVGGGIGENTYVTFAPVIQGSGDIKQQVAEAYDEFERKIDAYFARKRRVGYGT